MASLVDTASAGSKPGEACKARARSVVKASRLWSDRRRLASTLPATLRSQGSALSGTTSSLRQAMRKVSPTVSLAASGVERLAAYA